MYQDIAVVFFESRSVSYMRSKLKSFEGMGSGEGKLFPKVSLPQPPEANYYEKKYMYYSW